VSVEGNNHEAATLEAIRQNAGGLAGISGERLWVELKKILSGNHIKELVHLMVELGVYQHVGLPNSPNMNEFNTVWERLKDLQPHPITLLATLLNGEDQMMSLHSRLKVSAFERDLGLFLVTYRDQYDPTRDGIEPLQELVINSKSNQRFTQEFCLELIKYSGGRSLLASLKEWTPPKFPLSGKVLVERGMKSPKKFQRVMGDLRSMWIESRFTMTSAQLEEKIDDVLKAMEKEKR
jgi:tRNA nucleotidyltransferase (CCA-adding enzyme)